MSLFLKLLKLQLNQRLGLSALRASFRDETRKTLLRALVYVVAVVGVGTLIGMYAWLLTLLVPSFVQMGLEKVLLGLVLLAAMVLVFVMGLIYIIGMLFFAKDTEFLAALPIPQRTVFAAKFGQVLLSEMATGAAILVPAFVVYGIQAPVGALYWARALLTTLLMPCIPLALSGLLSLLLMRFNALWRRRDLLTVVGSVLLVVVVFAGQMLLQSSIPQDMTTDAVMALVADSSGILRAVVSAFPPAGWAAEGVLGMYGPLLLFIAVSLAALALVTWVSGKVYYAGAMAQLETSAARRKARLDGRNVRRHGPVFSLFLREWKTVLRTPVYALNGLITIIVGPLMILMMTFMQGAASGAEELAFFFDLLKGAVDTRLVVLLLAAAFMAIASINPAAGTTLSREGKLFYLSRMIPISPARQVLSKLLFGFSVSALTMIVMGLTGMLALGISPLVVLAGVLLGIAASVGPMVISLLPDILKPKLNWNSETEAIKQNINGMIGMLFGWAYIALLVFLCVKAIGAGMDLTLLIGLLTLLFAVFGAAAVFGICRAAKRSYRAIEG